MRDEPSSHELSFFLSSTRTPTTTGPTVTGTAGGTMCHDVIDTRMGLHSETCYTHSTIFHNNNITATTVVIVQQLRVRHQKPTLLDAQLRKIPGSVSVVFRLGMRLKLMCFDIFVLFCTSESCKFHVVVVNWRPVEIGHAFYTVN